MLALYENIRKRREELGLSQQELADLLGYKSRSTIAKIELGENDIPQSKIISFAKALKTTPQALMGWQNNMPSAWLNTDNFSYNIQYYMQYHRLSISNFAKKLGNIEARRLSDLIEQKEQPTDEEVSIISEALNISPFDLLNKKMMSFIIHSDELGNDSTNELDVVELNYGYGIREIVDRCTELNINGINKVLDYIEDLSDIYHKN